MNPFQCLTSVINLWNYTIELLWFLESPQVLQCILQISGTTPQKMWSKFRDLWVIPICKVLDIWLAFNPHRVATLCASCSREYGHPNRSVPHLRTARIVLTPTRRKKNIFSSNIHINSRWGCYFLILLCSLICGKSFLVDSLWKVFYGGFLGWTVPLLNRFSTIGLPLWAGRNH